MTVDYHHHEKTRRPATYVWTALFAGVLLFAFFNNAPWYFMLPVLFGLSLLVWAIIVNRKSGMNLNGSSLTMFSGKWQKAITFSDITCVKIKHWSDGAPSIDIVMKNAKPERVPHNCFGSAKELSDALAARGIPVVNS